LAAARKLAVTPSGFPFWFWATINGSSCNYYHRGLGPELKWANVFSKNMSIFDMFSGVCKDTPY
jgi:hypothetical protein